MFFNPATDEFHEAGHLVQPPTELCDFQQLIATRGGRDFYNGTAARLVLKDLHELGTAITAADLAAYQVQWTDAHRVPLRAYAGRGGEDDESVGDGVDVHVTPAPSSGPLLAMMLRVLNGFEWRTAAEERTDVVALHRLAEVFKWAFAERMEMGDPAFLASMEAVSGCVGGWAYLFHIKTPKSMQSEQNPEQFADNITSASFAAYVRQHINPARTHDNPEAYGMRSTGGPPSPYGTAHVSVISPNGDAISVTSTINY